VQEAWGKGRIMQECGMYKSSPARRSVQEAWGKPQSLRHLSVFGSEYEKTTATLNLTNQSASSTSHERSISDPGVVVTVKKS
jgi:hypothetical protein